MTFQRACDRTFPRLITAVCLSAAVGGCGGAAGHQGPTGTVSGVVTRNDAAISSPVIVSFIATQGFTATGQTDSGGDYALDSNGNPQIPVGTYRVAVMPASAMAQSADPAQTFNPSTGEGKTVEADTSVVPAKYFSPTASGLTYEIKEGANTIDIDLKD